MKLSLKNIGNIQEAAVEINGITVIAGENNTGKSTVGKTLYSIFNSFYAIDKQIRVERVQSIKTLLDRMYLESLIRMNNGVSLDDIAEEIVDYCDGGRQDLEGIQEVILNSLKHYDKNLYLNFEQKRIEELYQQIIDVLKVSKKEILKIVLNKKLNVEFNDQINNVFSEDDGFIRLQIKEQMVSIEISDNSVTGIDNSIDLRTEAVYLDDPFVMDEQKMMKFFGYSSYYVDHKTHLRNKLFTPPQVVNVINEIVTINKFENIYQKINEVCSGDIVKSGRSWGYRKADTGKVFDIRNLSTGLKTFVILKTLLVNGTIEADGTIILDEPEIHLHPEWQLIFAELIVLIQKEFNMHILLNTHSPYFLRAIQVYSAKYEIADKCRYYLSELSDDLAVISDVTFEVERIYKKLSYPLQKLEDERWQDD